MAMKWDVRKGTGVLRLGQFADARCWILLGWTNGSVGGGTCGL
ncbi:hypothetical protein NC652_012070 [Populus alba x Populus x berolinensis]|nr:hypothetical protein NC652_012070 [Populus alba x Populus x berolinensis]